VHQYMIYPIFVWYLNVIAGEYIQGPGILYVPRLKNWKLYTYILFIYVYVYAMAIKEMAIPAWVHIQIKHVLNMNHRQTPVPKPGPTTSLYGNWMVLKISCNVVPHNYLSWFITSITVVYGRYIELVNGVYNPIYNVWGAHIVHIVGDTYANMNQSLWNIHIPWNITTINTLVVVNIQQYSVGDTTLLHEISIFHPLYSRIYLLKI
jgi:hypothetical protein